MSDKPADQTLPEPIKFFATILYSDGEYAVESFDTLPELTKRVRDFVDKDVSVFAFAGAQLKVSKPPFRHLLTPWGPQPLFEVPEQFEPDDTGYLGLDPILLADPPEIKSPKSATHNEDEFFDDDAAQELGVFDSALPDPDS